MRRYFRHNRPNTLLQHCSELWVSWGSRISDDQKIGIMHCFTLLQQQIHTRQPYSVTDQTIKKMDLVSTDPETRVGVPEDTPAICVRIVDVHVSCSSHCVTHLAAFFIDPQSNWSTAWHCIRFQQSVSSMPIDKKDQYTVLLSRKGRLHLNIEHLSTDSCYGMLLLIMSKSSIYPNLTGTHPHEALPATAKQIPNEPFANRSLLTASTHWPVRQSL